MTSISPNLATTTEGLQHLENTVSPPKPVDSKIIKIAEYIFVDHLIKIGFAIGVICITVAVVAQLPLIPVIGVIAGSIFFGTSVRHLLLSNQKEIETLLPKISQDIDEIKKILTEVTDAKEIRSFGNYCKSRKRYIKQMYHYLGQMNSLKNRLEHANSTRIRHTRHECLMALRELQSHTEHLKLESKLFILSCRYHKKFLDSKQPLFEEKKKELETVIQALADLKRDSTCQSCQQFYDPHCKMCLQNREFKDEIGKCERLLKNSQVLLESIQYGLKSEYLYQKEDELLESCTLWSKDLAELSSKITQLSHWHHSIDDLRNELQQALNKNSELLEIATRHLSNCDKIASHESLLKVKSAHHEYEDLKKIHHDNFSALQGSDPLIIQHSLSRTKGQIKQIERFTKKVQKLFDSMQNHCFDAMLQTFDSMQKEFNSRKLKVCESVLDKLRDSMITEFDTKLNTLLNESKEGYTIAK